MRGEKQQETNHLLTLLHGEQDQVQANQGGVTLCPATAHQTSRLMLIYKLTMPESYRVWLRRCLGCPEALREPSAPAGGPPHADVKKPIDAQANW